MVSGRRAVLQQDQRTERPGPGLDEKNQKGGTFAESSPIRTGRSITQAFVQQGADVIFPVAGGTGLARVRQPRPRAERRLLLGRHRRLRERRSVCKYFLSSVTKNLTDSVTQYATKASSGTFPTGSYIGV